MDKDEFVALVAELRECQKGYFKTRDPIYLNKSKRLEYQVDKAIKEFQGTQKKLFEGTDG